MTLVKGKIKICQTKLSDFNIELINNSPFYRRYNEFVRIFKNRLPGMDAERLFTQPLENTGDGAIDWYMMPTNGEQPVKLTDLQEGERDVYVAIKNDVLQKLQSALNISNSNERAYIDCALKYLQGDYVDDVTYCYDNQITFAIWGMGMRKGREVSRVITDTVKDHRMHKVTYRVQGNGTIVGPNSILRRHDHILSSAKDIPNIEPAARYEFVAWQPDAPHGKSVTKDMEYVAVCEHTDKYLITFTSGEGGHLDGDLSLEKKKGESIFKSTLPTPVPDDGYSFKKWSPAIKENTLVDDDAEYTALFEKGEESVSLVPPVLPIPPIMRNVHFDAEENGILPESYSDFQTEDGSVIPTDKIPFVTPKETYQFTGWNRQTTDPIASDITFIAQYNKVRLPWYKRWWLWLTGRGCLKWLLWLLFMLLLLGLLLFLLRSCNGCSGKEHNGVVPVDTFTRSDGRVVDDNGYTRPITDDTGKLPDGDDIVSPVLGEGDENPPIEEQPGAPNIIGNRLFLFLENEKDDINALAQDFKKAYPSDQYSIIGFDREVKLLVVQIPENERTQIRKTINSHIPNHRFFVFDEEIYELNGHVSTDPKNIGWHLKAIHLQQGWQTTKGSANVTVAVVDDGIDASHPMFTGRIVNAYNVFTQDNQLSFGEGHGTHTAGLAVGSAEFYNKGASGVAPNCKLMPIQVFDNKQCPLSALVAGVMYAVHHGADVVNMSIGPSFKGLNQLPVEKQNQIAREQFKNVERLWTRVCNIAAKKKSILVFAAGNDDILSSIPPENRNSAAIVVTAVDSKLYPTDFTNYGSCSDISAPGKDIYSSFPVSKFQSYDGTSMAAPIVSGTVALMKSIKKDLTVEQVRNVLYSTGANVYGYIPPMVLVDKALEGVKRGDFSKPQKRDVHPVPEADSDGSLASSTPVAIPAQPQIEESPRAESSINGTDYEAIRAKISEYRKKISELENLLHKK